MGSEAISTFAVSLATYLLQAVGNVVIGGLLLWLHRTHPRRYLADWGWSWLALGGYHLFAAAAFYLAARQPASDLLRLTVSSASLILACAQLAWLAQGTRDMATGRRLSPRAFRALLFALAGVAIVATIASAGATAELRLFVRVGLRSLAAAVVLGAAAIAVRHVSRRHEGIGPRLLAGAFLLYAVDQLHYFVVLAAGFIGLRLASPFPFTAMIDFLLQIGIGIGMTVWLLEQEQHELRRAGRQMAHDQHNLRLLFEQMPVILWSVDRELRIVSSAGSGLRAVGVGPGEIVGLRLDEVLAGDPAAPTALERHRRALAGDAVAFDSAWRARDFHVRLEPLRESGGEIVGCLGVALDVTEQRQREASYPETQRLESLGVLAGGIAHDLANLLTGVLGHAELSLERLAPDAAARRHLESAIEGVHRCGDLTHQLLAYAGRAEAQRAPLELGSLVRGMGDLLRVSLAANCALSYELGERLPPIDGDAAQLRQVVMNLITNAAEAIGEDGGTLAVAVGARRLAAAELAGFQFGDRLQAGEFVALRVADSGAGMTADVLARIFEPFYTTKRAGRGLGLAAVLGIVREHNGAIRVASEPGRGTTFEILFPAAAVEQRAAS